MTTNVLAERFSLTIKPSPAMTSVVTPKIIPDVTPGHHVGIAGFAQAGDATVLDTDVALVNTGVIDDERVGDEATERVGLAHSRGRAHAFAENFAAAEFALVTEHVLDDQAAAQERRRVYLDKEENGPAIFLSLGACLCYGRRMFSRLRIIFWVGLACASQAGAAQVETYQLE